MVEKIKDLVFEEMEYDHGWTKTENLPFLNKLCKVEILVKCSSEDKAILDQQREGYKYFVENHEKINSEIPELIQNYIDKNKEEIRYYYTEIDNITNLSDIIRPRTLLFNRDGSIVFLCEVPWDEKGMGIQVYPEYKIDIQGGFI